MIYFAVARDINRFKIGYAKDPQERLKALQTGCPAKIEMVCTLEGADDRALEKELHHVFRHHHAHGEWFELNDVADMAIAWIKSGDPTPEDPVQYFLDWRLEDAAQRIKPLVQKFFTEALTPARAARITPAPTAATEALPLSSVAASFPRPRET